MPPQELVSILTSYGLQDETFQIIPIQGGLINHTWLLHGADKDFVLQRINDLIFKDPEKIDENIRTIGQYLEKNYPDYYFVTPIRTLRDTGICFLKDFGYFRIFPFVKGSHSISKVENTSQAREAAGQFGLFTKNLADFPASQLHSILPHFHDLEYRYNSFLLALAEGNKDRIEKSQKWIRAIEEQQHIVGTFIKIKTNPAYKQRVTHHDTKISNVLFNEEEKAICIVDLDTVMPGYFISDFGDMFRTYVSPVSEEEKDFSHIEIRLDFFEAIADGYLLHMGKELTETEKRSLVYAGKFGIYMQALRFLTDYFYNDKYYRSQYPGQNLFRSGNQLILLQKLMESEKELINIQNQKI